MTDVRTKLEKSLATLVAHDTTSSRSNLPLVETVQGWLEAGGFACERQVYQDEAGIQKANLLARRGPPGERAELALVAHTDCVPYDAAWKEALVLTARDERLYGRGACDTKAFLACAVQAALRVPESALERPLLLLFTADEEVGCLGAKRLVDEGLGRARYAIVGEPTQLTPIRAGKGYCLADVEIVGKEGHSAYPASGASAVFGAARYIERFERWAKEVLPSEVDVHFDPPFTTVNVGVIHGGKAKNIIPGSCRFVVEWRPIPGQPVERVEDSLKGLARALCVEDLGLRVNLQVHRTDRGFDTPLETRLVEFLTAQSGNAPGTVAFGTEAPQLCALGAEAVVFGPGDIRVAHQTGEFVPVAELVRCEAILEQAIHTFCGRP